MIFFFKEFSYLRQSVHEQEGGAEGETGSPLSRETNGLDLRVLGSRPEPKSDS